MIWLLNLLLIYLLSNTLISVYPEGYLCGRAYIRAPSGATLPVKLPMTKALTPATSYDPPSFATIPLYTDQDRWPPSDRYRQI